MDNVSLVVIVAVALKPVVNPAMQAMGWHQEGDDSFYLLASSDGEAPATHAYLRAQGRVEVGDFLDAIAAGNWPDTPPSFILSGAGVSTWDDLGLTARYRAALTAGITVSVMTEAQLTAAGFDYASHATSVLDGLGLRPLSEGLE